MTFATGKRHGGLYLLELSPPPFASTTLPGSHFDLWHWRLGHPAFSLSPQLKVLDNTISISNKCTCIVCPLAKQTRLPFPNSMISTSFCFELIHLDVWGPYRIPSMSGARYFFIVVDDFSRSTWVFLMNTKIEVNYLIPHFFAMVKTQFNTEI